MKNIFGCIAILLFILQLTACDTGLNGQIEKCVQAGIEANKPYKDSKERADTELGLRGFCMRSAAGKD